MDYKGKSKQENQVINEAASAPTAAELAALTASFETPEPLNPTIERRRSLSAAAKRALAEAEERRHTAGASGPAKEMGGRGGLDPVRFGDWEINGRAIDF